MPSGRELRRAETEPLDLLGIGSTESSGRGGSAPAELTGVSVLGLAPGVAPRAPANWPAACSWRGMPSSCAWFISGPASRSLPGTPETKSATVAPRSGGPCGGACHISSLVISMPRSPPLQATQVPPHLSPTSSARPQSQRHLHLVTEDFAPRSSVWFHEMPKILPVQLRGRGEPARSAPGSRYPVEAHIENRSPKPRALSSVPTTRWRPPAMGVRFWLTK